MGTNRRMCPIMDPDYNRRKICREMILLEDHLFKECERCRDCIRKHLLKIQALADEMGSLDKSGKYSKLSSVLSNNAEVWLQEVENINFDHDRATKALHGVGQRVRRCRKKLVSHTLSRSNQMEPSLNTLEEDIDSLSKESDIKNGAINKPVDAAKGMIHQLKSRWQNMPESYKTVIGTGAALIGGSYFFK